MLLVCFTNHFMSLCVAMTQLLPYCLLVSSNFFFITEQTAQVKLPVVIAKMGNFSFISTKNNSRAIAAMKVSIMNFHPVTKCLFSKFETKMKTARQREK